MFNSCTSEWQFVAWSPYGCTLLYHNFPWCTRYNPEGHRLRSSKLWGPCLALKSVGHRHLNTCNHLIMPNCVTQAACDRERSFYHQLLSLGRMRLFIREVCGLCLKSRVLGGRHSFPSFCGYVYFQEFWIFWIEGLWGGEPKGSWLGAKSFQVFKREVGLITIDLFLEVSRNIVGSDRFLKVWSLVFYG